MKEQIAWNTKGFVDRMHQLNRVKLRDLYPSEAWSMYRILPQVNQVIDICCGGSNMSQIVKAINPSIDYTGVELNEKLVQEGNDVFGSETVRFICSDVFDFLNTCTVQYECVMAWAAVTHFADMYGLIDKLFKLAGRFFLFDVRLTDTDSTVADEKIAWTEYDGMRHPYYIAATKEFFEFLKIKESELRAVEIAGYDYPFGSTSWVSPDILQPGVFSVVLEKKRKEDTSETDWFLRIPPAFLKLIGDTQ